MQYNTIKTKLSNVFNKGDRYQGLQSLKPDEKDIIDQINLSEYSTYNDYLTIVMEFANLILFAEYFPWAPLLLIIFNCLEIRIDMISLCNLVRRPNQERKRNIGSWQIILFIISCMSIFTNLFFSLFIVEDQNAYKALNLGDLTGHISTTTSNLYMFFLIEHFVFILLFLIRYFSSNTAPWVAMFLERREFKSKQNKWKKMIERFQIAKHLKEE